MEGESSSSSKKRKTIHQDHDDNSNIDDEEKMELFFALIKSIRDSRHRLTNSSAASADPDAADCGDDGEKRKAVWKPSFQREDFMDEEARELKGNPPVTLAAAERVVDVAQQLKDDPRVTLGAGHVAGNVDEKQKLEETSKEVIDLNLSL